MSPVSFIKANWRVLLLVTFLVVSLGLIFFPGDILADDGDFEGEEGPGSGIHNIQFGLGLEGGTQISAPVVGQTVEGVELDIDDHDEFEREAATIQENVSSELELETGDTLVRTDAENREISVEIFTYERSAAEFAQALQNAGVDASEDDVRDGVTRETRDDIETTIESRINEAGLSGSSVSQAEMDGTHYIVVQAPDLTDDELQAILEDRGLVEIVLHYPDGEGGQTNETGLVQADMGEIGTPSYDSDRGQHYVPVDVNPEPARQYEELMRDTGFTANPGACQYGSDEADGSNYCLLTMVDGEVVDAHSLAPNLADSMDRGEWAGSGNLRMVTPTQQDAQTLSINLRAGELRAPLDFDRDQTYTISPALADQFKNYSLIIGILSILAVSGMVYLRYGDRRVALPLIVTALSEVVILLGIAVLLRMPLDLSHVAGFIAVVGTGVDDLIIIADEVLEDGDVNSRRVFESRFRKAFWIIGAAAATTIIAMSPLAVLSLGDLRGFAIITILGVLIGVLVTRPAYGDILRRLMTDK